MLSKLEIEKNLNDRTLPEQKAEKYNSLVKKIKQSIKDITSREDYDYAGTEWLESEVVDYLQELLKEVEE